MDGTLAEFKQVDTLEYLYEQGYFLNLRPQINVVNAIRYIVQNEPDVEVFILSSVLSDSKYAKQEKNDWIDMYLPEIDMRHRIYPDCGRDKLEAAREHLLTHNMMGDISFENSYLLDDYSKNLHAWDPPARGVKLMNGINGNYGTWDKERVFLSSCSDEIVRSLKQLMKIDDCSLSINHRRGR
jgi:hypothetical protein